ncbi:MAG: tetratricopeptide repeat protein [Planctomycetota bacterium]
MSERAVFVLSLLLLAASGAAYLPSLAGEYVYDDKRFVEENAAVRAGVPIPAYFTDASTQTADESWQGIYRPLRTLSFRSVALVSDSAGSQRAKNLLIHLVNVFLVWFLLRGILGRERPVPALLGALAFSLHPMASEAVAWISSRGDLLATTGILGAVLLHRRGSRVAAPVVLLLALLSKETAIVTPFLAAALDGTAKVRSRWKDYAVQVGVVAVYLAVRLAVLGADGFGQGYVVRENFLERTATVLAGTVYYVWTTLVPVDLTFEIRIERGADARAAALLGLMVTTVLLGGAVALRRRLPRTSLAIFWFFLTLAPVTLLQLAFPLKVAVANRFAYPALVAFGLLMALAAGRGWIRAALAAIVLVVFVPLTLDRADAFTTPEKLWIDVVSKDPENAIAHFDLGRLALDAGDPEKAREHLVESVKVDPRHPQVHALLGETFEALIGGEPADSPKISGYLAQAFNAYNAAVRLWQGGMTEDRQLYGMTLVNAAYLAGVVDRPKLVKEHAHNLVTNRPPVPGTGPMRKRMLHRMGRIAQYLELSGEAKLGGALRQAVARLEEDAR